MVEWTKREVEIINDIFKSIDFKADGGKALARCLVVYPWTQRYFSSFGNLSDAAAICSNKKVADHGEKVLKGLKIAVNDLSNIKNNYSKLSILHSEKLHVDPDNFKLLGDCLTVVLAAKYGTNFTPEVQTTFQKFMNVVVSALGRQYH